jgi:hypothetical protein
MRLHPACMQPMMWRYRAEETATGPGSPRVAVHGGAWLGGCRYDIRRLPVYTSFHDSWRNPVAAYNHESESIWLSEWLLWENHAGRVFSSRFVATWLLIGCILQPYNSYWLNTLYIQQFQGSLSAARCRSATQVDEFAFLNVLSFVTYWKATIANLHIQRRVCRV